MRTTVTCPSCFLPRGGLLMHLSPSAKGTAAVASGGCSSPRGLRTSPLALLLSLSPSLSPTLSPSLSPSLSPPSLAALLAALLAATFDALGSGALLSPPVSDSTPSKDTRSPSSPTNSSSSSSSRSSSSSSPTRGGLDDPPSASKSFAMRRNVCTLIFPHACSASSCDS